MWSKNVKHLRSLPIIKSSSTATSIKNEYYKDLANKMDYSRPSDWNKALPYSEIPGPKPVPVFGLKGKFLPFGEYFNMAVPQIYAKWQEQFGNIVLLKGLRNGEDMVFLYDPKEMEKMFRNEGPWPSRQIIPSFVEHRLTTRKEVFNEFKGLISVQGEDWFRQRSLVNPILMNPKNVSLYVPHIDAITEDFVQKVRNLAKANREMPADFLNEIYNWALESITYIALNIRLGNLQLENSANPNLKFLKAILNFFDLLYYLDEHPLKKFYSFKKKELHETLDFITDFCIEKVKAVLDERKDHEELNVLQQLIKADPEIALPMTIDLLIAGVDTTGRILGAVLYFLAKNQQKQTRLREELLQLLPDKNTPLSKEILNKAVYLRACVKESLRLAPIGLGNIRRSVKDLVLGGYQIPRGTQIVTAQYFTSTSDKFMKDAKDFIPERWLRSCKEEFGAVNPFVSAPFGFGPRSCIGQRFATLELEVGTAKMIRNFEFSWPHDDMQFKLRLLFGIADPLKLHVEEVDI